MKRYHFTKPPRSLYSRNIRFDNLALVPASLLPSKADWQQLANSLPQGGVLIILPTSNSPQRHILETTATLLRAKGHQVTTLSWLRSGAFY